MKFGPKLLALGTAAACAWLGSNHAAAADTHSVIINAISSSKCVLNTANSTITVTVDPAATTTLTPTTSVMYRCTTGTTPSFALTSANSGNLIGPGTFSYGYSSSGTAAGTGMGTAQAKAHVVAVTIDQALTADQPPGTYSDTITVTVTP